MKIECRTLDFWTAIFSPAMPLRSKLALQSGGWSESSFRFVEVGGTCSPSSESHAAGMFIALYPPPERLDLRDSLWRSRSGAQSDMNEGILRTATFLDVARCSIDWRSHGTNSSSILSAKAESSIPVVCHRLRTTSPMASWYKHWTNRCPTEASAVASVSGFSFVGSVPRTGRIVFSRSPSNLNAGFTCAVQLATIFAA
jgi:hypothetical protein